MASEIIIQLAKMKLGKAAGPSEVNMDIMANGKFGVGVIKLCQRVVDGKGMPIEWKTSVVVTIFRCDGLWSI